MRHRIPVRIVKIVGIVAFVCAVGGAAAGQPSGIDRHAGTWAGTWDGAGSGAFELTLDKKEGAAAGRVAVTTDNGNYAAELKSVAFDGNKLTAKYDFRSTRAPRS